MSFTFSDEWIRNFMEYNLTIIGITIAGASFVMSMYLSERKFVGSNKEIKLFFMTISLLLVSVILIPVTIWIIYIQPNLADEIKSTLYVYVLIPIIPVIVMSIILGIEHPRGKLL